MFPVSDKDNLFLNMKLKFIFIFLCAALSLSCFGAYAQEQGPDDEAKRIEEAIQASLEQMEKSLKLESWQVFYLDSILTHDYNALAEELKQMQAVKVSNSDLYYQTQDKWAEQIYNSFHGVLNEDQWNKYLKSGASKDKKARDKRAAKRQKDSEK